MKISKLFGLSSSLSTGFLSLWLLLTGAAISGSPEAVTVEASPPAANSSNRPDSVPPVAVPQAAEASVDRFSPGVQDVLKLLDAKVDVAVVKEYIKNSTVGYDLNAAEIVALKKRGVPDEIVTALLQRGAEVRAQVVSLPAVPRPPYNGSADAYAPGYGYGYADNSYNSYPYASDYSYPYYNYGYPYSYWYSYSYPWWGYSPFFYYVDAHGHHHYYHHYGHYDGHSNGHHGNWNSANSHGAHNVGMPNQNRSPFGTYSPNRGGFANGASSPFGTYYPNRAGFAGNGTRSPFGTFMPQRSAVSRPPGNFGGRPMAYAARTAGFGGRPTSFAAHGGGGTRSGGGFGGRAGGGGHR